MHRLDRDTSGLMVVAKTEQAYARLQSLVRGRKLEREYLALVRGKPQSLRGRIEAPIGRDRNDPLRHSLDTDTPREAVTHFELLELLPEHALLRVRLETGRTHQIRVHLAAIELPVSGDRLYGVKGDLGLERQFLHAARLAFPHPVTGGPVDVESAVAPADLARRARADAQRRDAMRGLAYPRRVGVVRRRLELPSPRPRRRRSRARACLDDVGRRCRRPVAVARMREASACVVSCIPRRRDRASSPPA